MLHMLEECAGIRGLSRYMSRYTLCVREMYVYVLCIKGLFTYVSCISDLFSSPHDLSLSCHSADALSFTVFWSVCLSLLSFLPPSPLPCHALSPTLSTLHYLRGTSFISAAGHKNSVTCVAFSHDGVYVASADLDGLIKVWQCESRQEVWSYECGSDITVSWFLNSV